jgi:hypothetical protein
LSDVKRVLGGQPEGGRYDAHRRDESFVNLGSVPSDLDGIAGLSRAADELEMRAGFDIIAANTRFLFAGATGVNLSRNTFGHWHLSQVLGDDGPMTEGNSKHDTENTSMYALDEIAQPILDKLGKSNLPLETGRVTAGLKLHFEPEPDGADVARRLADVEASMRSLEDARDVLRKDAVTAAVHADYPTATRVELETNEYDDGSTYFLVHGLRNELEQILWERNDHHADPFAENRALHGLVRDLNPAILDWEWVDHHKGITIFDL